MKANFKKLLENISNLNFEEQKDALEKTLVTWIGTEDQTDDILLLGIKI